MELTSPAPIKVLCVAGARPNFMKIAPILRAFAEVPAFAARLVHTGQHYDAKLSKVFFEDLKIPRPDVELEVGSGSHAQQTADIMRKFEPLLVQEQPHAVLVVGDVNSTVACAAVAAKFHLNNPFRWKHGLRLRPVIAHVEAGLRSFDDDMPEEINRKLTDAISDLLFVSEPSGMENLGREGVPAAKTHFVGNVMIDTLLAARDEAMKSIILAELALTEKRYALVTLHRPSNVDDPHKLQALLRSIARIADGMPVVFPVHPRTRARLDASGIELDAETFRLIEPAGYLDFIRLMASARLVLSDSGGVQEETTVLGVPCVTLRENTERPVTVSEGTNFLAGTDPATIERVAKEALSRPKGGKAPQFWDGSASRRIVHTFREVFLIDAVGVAPAARTMKG